MRELRKSIPIKSKIFTYLIGFCSILLMLLWLFQIVLLEFVYKSIKQYQIQQDTLILADYLTRGDLDSFRDYIGASHDLYVEVWSMENDSLLISGNYPGGVQSKLSYEDKAALYKIAQDSGGMAENRFCYKTALSARQQESILFAKVITSGELESHVLFTSSNLSPVSSAVDTIRLELYIIMAFMSMMAAWLAIIISRRISAPITDLNNSAKQLASGDFSVRFKGHGYREIEELSNTLNETAKELGKNESLRRELIANVSHDLRTPLTLITGYSEMMRDIPGESTPENIAVIIDESVRLTALVNDLLELSKLQAGIQELSLEPCCLTDHIRQVIGRFSRFCEKDGYVIHFEYTQEIVLQMDPEKTAQVIYNLMSNALHYTGEDKRIVVRQRTYGGQVIIEVEDSGPGISAEDAPYIWDRYYKVDQVHKRSETGTGLGLSIVKSILERHPDAQYGVRNAPIRGSIFWFSLPLDSSQ